MAAVAVVVAGVVAMGLLAAAGVDLVLTRNAIGLLPIGLVSVGVGVDLLARHRPAPTGYVVAGAIAAAGIVAVLAVMTDRQYQRTDWRDAAHVLTASATTHLVVLDPGTAQLPLSPYVHLRVAPHGSVLAREIDVVRFLLTTHPVEKYRCTVRSGQTCIGLGWKPSGIRTGAPGPRRPPWPRRVELHVDAAAVLELREP